MAHLLHHEWYHTHDLYICLLLIFSSSEPEAEPEKPPPTDAEIETELNKRQKELTSEKNQLTHRLELYKKVQKLEQEVADMKGELDTLKEARGLPTSSEGQ